MSDRQPNSEGIYISRRTLLRGSVVLGTLAAAADQVVTGGAIRRAIFSGGQAPQPTPAPVVIVASPTPANGENAGTTNLSPAEAAQLIINGGCKVEFLAPERTGKAKFVQTALMQLRQGNSDFSTNNLETMVNLPTDPTGGVNESGYWEVTEDFAYVRPVYVPQNAEGNLGEGSAVNIEHGIMREGDRFFSGLVFTGLFAAGNIAAYARANVYEVRATGEGCEAITPAVMESYMGNPSMPEGLAGQIQETLINK